MRLITRARSRSSFESLIFRRSARRFRAFSERPPRRGKLFVGIGRTSATQSEPDVNVCIAEIALRQGGLRNIFPDVGAFFKFKTSVPIPLFKRRRNNRRRERRQFQTLLENKRFPERLGRFVFRLPTIYRRSCNAATRSPSLISIIGDNGLLPTRPQVSSERRGQPVSSMSAVFVGRVGVKIAKIPEKF